MVLKINGVDIVPYIAFRGVAWQRSDVDASTTTRMLNGELRRKRVAAKRRLDITCRPLLAEEAKIVLNAISPVFVTVQYYDPQDGRVVERTMYSNNYPASYLIQKAEGEYWDGIEFPLIEK